MYKRDIEMTKNNRIKAYIQRTVFLKDFSKDMRTSNIFAVLMGRFKAAIDGNVEILRKYGWKLFVYSTVSSLFSEFIPIIGTYRFYQIAGAVDLFWKAILYGVILEVCDILPDLAPATMAKTIPALIVAIIGLVTSIASLILSIKFASRLSNAFGHGFWFTLGLIFFPYIFILILAFGRSKYCLEMPSGLIYKD